MTRESGNRKSKHRRSTSHNSGRRVVLSDVKSLKAGNIEHKPGRVKCTKPGLSDSVKSTECRDELDHITASSVQQNLGRSSVGLITKHDVVGSDNKNSSHNTERTDNETSSSRENDSQQDEQRASVKNKRNRLNSTSGSSEEESEADNESSDESVEEQQSEVSTENELEGELVEEREENNKRQRGRVLLELYESEQVYIGLLEEFSVVYMQDLIRGDTEVKQDFNRRSDLVALCATTQQLVVQGKQFLKDVRSEIRQVARTIQAGGGDVSALEQYFSPLKHHESGNGGKLDESALGDLTRIVSLANIGPAVTRHARLLHIYEQYAASFGFAKSDVQELMTKPSFTSYWRSRSTRPSDFRLSHHTSSVLGGSSTTSRRPSLEGYLILAIQRVPRYSLLLAEIDKATPPSMEMDLSQLRAAAKDIDSVAFGMNEAIRRSEHSQELLALQKKFIGGVVDLVGGLDANHSRWLVREGELMRMCRKSGKAYYFHLFNDTLLYSEKSSLGFKLHRALPVDASFSVASVAAYYHADHGIFLEASGPQAKPGLARRRPVAHAFEIKTPIKSFVVYAKTREAKEAWLHDLAAVQTHQQQRRSKLCEGPADTVAPVWQSESSAVICSICTAKFTFLKRKHHCRRCGVIVCEACSDRKRIIRFTDPDAVRVCDVCKLEMDFTPLNLAPHQHRMAVRVERLAVAPAPPGACESAGRRQRRRNSAGANPAPRSNMSVPKVSLGSVDPKAFPKRMYFWLTTAPSLRSATGAAAPRLPREAVDADRSEAGSVTSESTRNTNYEAAALEQFSLHVARSNGLKTEEEEGKAGDQGGHAASRGPSSVGKLQGEAFFSIPVGDLLDRGSGCNATMHCMGVGVGQVGEIKLSFSKLLRQNPALVQGQMVAQTHSFVLHGDSCKHSQGERVTHGSACMRVSLMLSLRLHAPPLLWAVSPALQHAKPSKQEETEATLQTAKQEDAGTGPSAKRGHRGEAKKPISALSRMSHLRIEIPSSGNEQSSPVSPPISPSAQSVSSSGSSINPNGMLPVDPLFEGSSQHWNSGTSSSKSSGQAGLHSVPETRVHGSADHEPSVACAKQTPNAVHSNPAAALAAAPRFSGIRRPRASSFGGRSMVSTGLSKQQQTREQKQWEQRALNMVLERRNRFRLLRPLFTRKQLQGQVALEGHVNLEWLSQVSQYCLAQAHPSRWAIHSVSALFHHAIEFAKENKGLHLQDDLEKRLAVFQVEVAAKRSAAVEQGRRESQESRALHKHAAPSKLGTKSRRLSAVVRSSKSKAFTEANHKAPRLLVLHNLLVTEQHFLDSMQVLDVVFIQPLLEIAHGAKLHLSPPAPSPALGAQQEEDSGDFLSAIARSPVDRARLISPKSTVMKDPIAPRQGDVEGSMKPAVTFAPPVMARGCSDSGVWSGLAARKSANSIGLEGSPSNKGVRVQEQSRFRRHMDMLSAAMQIKVPRGTNKTKAVAEVVRRPGVTLFLDSVRQILTINSDFYITVIEMIAGRSRSMQVVHIGDAFERFIGVMNAYEVYFAFFNSVQEALMPQGSLEASSSAALLANKSSTPRGSGLKWKAVGFLRQRSSSLSQEELPASRERSDTLTSTASASSPSGESAQRDLADMLLGLEQDPRCQGRKLEDLLLLPLQRLGWYIDALETLIDATSASHKDMPKLSKCLQLLRSRYERHVASVTDEVE